MSVLYTVCTEQLPPPWKLFLFISTHWCVGLFTSLIRAFTFVRFIDQLTQPEVATYTSNQPGTSTPANSVVKLQQQHTDDNSHGAGKSITSSSGAFLIEMMVWSPDIEPVNKYRGGQKKECETPDDESVQSSKTTYYYFKMSSRKMSGKKSSVQIYTFNDAAVLYMWVSHLNSVIVLCQQLLHEIWMISIRSDGDKTLWGEHFHHYKHQSQQSVTSFAFNPRNEENEKKKEKTAWQNKTKKKSMISCAWW